MTTRNRMVNFAQMCPNPQTYRHIDGTPGHYVCHLAAIHWAAQSIGYSGPAAAKVVERYIQSSCIGCINPAPPSAPVKTPNKGFRRFFPFMRRRGKYDVPINSMHVTGNHMTYGHHFCQGAIAVPNRRQLSRIAAPGDVLIFDHPRNPQHSMVVVASNPANPNTVLARGYNNARVTQNDAPQGMFDPSPRNMALPKYWSNNDTLVGTSPVHIVPHNTFITNLRRFIYSPR
ncbi:hypothetical protein [Marinibactrum halimedae]|uniref:hypothetical protein n=1 Tax=Marinibactrum halimedae TaxID=1444977 RepID=UPI001E4A8D92|nr:hypothetical protein [Marinibactrum halimedae]MCD9458863.1 hypothetical protein [Marinibactrum halimedae]